MSSSQISVSGKVVVITGASMGIGEAIAKLFVDEGARVVLLSSRPGTVVREWRVGDGPIALHDEITGRLRQVITSHAA